MMRSLYSGVSGLKNHQVRMDVVGNNIANVNTYGFKTERVSFQDLISQSMSGASEPKAERGGINPKQIGLGTMTASIDKLMHQGTLQNTGKITDLAISGEGFFIVKKGDQSFYTRAGNFDVDKSGLLVNPANGMKVQGWAAQMNANGQKFVNPAGSVNDIIIPLYSKDPAKATTFASMKSNLNAAVPAVPANATDAERYEMIVNKDHSQRRGHITSMDVYDDEGKQHELKMFMWKSGTNRWTASVSVSDASQLSVDVLGSNGQNTNVPGNTRIELGFTADGRLTMASDGVDSKTQGKLTADISFRVAGKPTTSNIELRLGDVGQVNGVTQFASQSTTKLDEQDGHPMGYMESFQIDASGLVTGTYTNGSTQSIAQVALANFTNPEGLNKSGQNNFSESINSGNAIIGEAGLAGRGDILASNLEMSNVDLSDQFTDMIVTQRGFQANSRSITTSDQMLQELLSLKR